MRTNMNLERVKWNWMFWHDDRLGEREIIIYSPGSHLSEIDEYFVVVLFRNEPDRHWWVCQFVEDANGEITYLRVENCGDRLREAMMTAYAMNKMIGAY